tara:strand:- start:415 stop:690 length:276 start_codon:yes stop_codon:yes gene_type:complete
MKNDFYTIEPDGYGEFSVYEWGVYEQGSVLAGQQRKSFVADFATVDEALKTYPKADVMGGRVAPAPVSVMHLPDREMNAYEEEGYFHPNDY